MEEDGDSPPPLPLSGPHTSPTAQHEDNEAADASSPSLQGFQPYGTGPGGLTTDLVDQQTRGYHVRAHERPPPLYQATMGLAAAYKHITEHKDRRRPRAFSTSETHLYTSDDGTLRLGPHLPLILGRYRFVRLVGQGTFAQIICAEDTFHPRRRHVAIKILNFHYAEIGKREALCLRLVHESPEGPHAAVVRFHAVFDFMGHFCIVMELCLGGSFQHYVRPLSASSPPLVQEQEQLQFQQQQYRGSPKHGGRGGGGGPSAGAAGLAIPQVREAALHLVKALLLLHNHDVIHADIKPENVLLAGSGPGGGLSAGGRGGGGGGGGWGQQVRLTDLGNAIKSREIKLYKEDYEIQTLGYRAPEVLLGGCGGQAFNHQIDMWSLGVLLVELYLGRPLFRAASKVLMLKRILSVLGPLPAREYVSGKFYTAFFGSDHRLRPETFGLRDDPTHAATALIDPRKIQNSFVYDGDVHYRLVCDLLRSRDPDFIGFVCGLLQFDPRVRLTAFQALMHPYLAPCFPFSLLKPFLSVASLEILEKGRQPMASLPPGSSRTRMVSSSSSFSSSASDSSSPSSSSFFAPARGEQQTVQLKEEEVEEEEEEEEEEEGDGLVAIVESSSSSPFSFRKSTEAEAEEEPEAAGAAAATVPAPVAATTVADICRINQQHLQERERKGILALASTSSLPLSPDSTPAHPETRRLLLEDSSSPPPLALEREAIDVDVVLLDEEEEEEDVEKKAVVANKKDNDGAENSTALPKTKATKQPAVAVAMTGATTSPPHSSSSFNKRPCASTGGEDSGGSTGSSGGGGRGRGGVRNVGGGGGEGFVIKKKEESNVLGSESKKGMIDIKAASSGVGKTSVRKWYEEVAAEEEEDMEDKEAHSVPASLGKRKSSLPRHPSPAKQQLRRERGVEEEDSAGEDELIL